MQQNRTKKIPFTKNWKSGFILLRENPSFGASQLCIMKLKYFFPLAEQKKQKKSEGLTILK